MKGNGLAAPDLHIFTRPWRVITRVWVPEGNKLPPRASVPGVAAACRQRKPAVVSVTGVFGYKTINGRRRLVDYEDLGHLQMSYLRMIIQSEKEISLYRNH